MSADNNLSDRLSFIKMDAEAIERLRSIKPLIMEELPGAIAEFYKQVRAFPETKKFFSSDAHMDAASGLQLQHWDRISSGKLDQNYVRAVTKIGEIHARVGLEPRWFLGGYGIIAQELVGAILKKRWPQGGMFVKGPKSETVSGELGALIKAVMLDIDFASRSISTFRKSPARRPRQKPKPSMRP